MHPSVHARANPDKPAIVMATSGETISYKMPTVTVDGSAVFYYAAWKHHIGLYPVPVFDGELEAEIAPLRAAKDSLHLKYTEPFPYDLVARLTVAIIEHRDRGEH
jgi:uncharacterized protein YdhG (YjbR/CyaY superfamily)